MNNVNCVRRKNPSKLGSILVAAMSFSAILGSGYHQLLADEKTRWVMEDDCRVYCGPNAALYATTKLARGATVEVYHETADGWSGIRPPAGSFNWVAAEAGHLLSGGQTLQIVGAPTPAWIGTYESIARDDLKWQVELKPTQKVSVIGEAIQPQKNGADRTWFKIQPPPGEFRWMRTELLASKPLPSNELLKNKSSNVVSAQGQHRGVGTRAIDESDSDSEAVVQAGAVQRVNASSKNYPSVARKAISQNITPVPDANSMNTELPSTAELPAPVRSLPSDSVPSQRSLLSGQGQSNMPNGIDSDAPNDTSSTISMDPEQVEGQIVDGQIIDGQIIDGQVVTGPFVDGPFVDGEVFEGEIVYEDGMATCDTCGVASGCDCVDAHGNVGHWDSMHGPAGPRLKVHPIGKILGLVGFGIAEADIVQPDPSCTSCMPGTPTMSFGSNPPSPSPRFSDRFQHLPRPGRRMRTTVGPGWTGDSGYSPSDSGYVASPGNTNTNLLGNQPWHSSSFSAAGVNSGITGGGITPQLNSNMSLSSAPIQSRLTSEARQPFGSNDIALVANEDLDSIHFSTPEIQQAMLDLTSIVARPMEQWSLIGPMNQAKSWIENTNDTIARGEARLLLDRIERFEGLRQRSMSNAGGFSSGNAMPGLSASAPISYAGFQRPISSIGAPAEATPNAPPLDQTRNPDGTPSSDASGWLVEVFSQQPGQPEFALTDDAGGLIAYVVASPGMNLRRYLKQPVGVYGVKGYLPNLSARQITAERIVRVR
jgi:hypothetical protein